MLNTLIEAHIELEKELQRAIGNDCATQVIETIDAKISELDRSIRQTVPSNEEEARAKLGFFLSRILTVGGGIVSRKDIATIEELFDHVLAGHGDLGQTSRPLVSNNKS